LAKWASSIVSWPVILASERRLEKGLYQSAELPDGSLRFADHLVRFRINESRGSVF
jgi:hypothetical protein